MYLIKGRLPVVANPTFEFGSASEVLAHKNRKPALLLLATTPSHLNYWKGEAVKMVSEADQVNYMLEPLPSTTEEVESLQAASEMGLKRKLLTRGFITAFHQAG